MAGTARAAWLKLVTFALATAALAGCPGQKLLEVEVDFDAGRLVPGGSATHPRDDTLRFSVAAMQSPRGTYSGYTRMLDLVGQRLGVGVELVQRRTYRETNELLLAGQTDVALICTGGYFDLKRSAPAGVEVLAVPVVRGTTTYRSLVIVPMESRAERLLDLAGKRFAFTDELSFSGHLYPLFAVRQLGLDPDRFFPGAVFTSSHDRSVEAVARGFVDGAAVDSNIYFDLVGADAQLARRVRVLEESPPFGIPPVVALPSLGESTRARVRAALLALHEDGEAARVLKSIGIERFVAPPEGLYDSAEVVARARR